MQRIIMFFIALTITTGLMAQPPAGEAKKGDFYGVKPSKKGVTNIAGLPSVLEKQPTAHVKVKAMATEVCANKGCWVALKVDEKTTAFVKMKDYAFFVPVAAAGKMLIVEGEATIKTTSVEELRHYAEDAGKSEAEIHAITEPVEEIRILASGIRVL